MTVTSVVICHAKTNVLRNFGNSYKLHHLSELIVIYIQNTFKNTSTRSKKARQRTK